MKHIGNILYEINYTGNDLHSPCVGVNTYDENKLYMSSPSVFDFIKMVIDNGNQGDIRLWYGGGSNTYDQMQWGSEEFNSISQESPWISSAPATPNYSSFGLNIIYMDQNATISDGAKYIVPLPSELDQNCVSLSNIGGTLKEKGWIIEGDYITGYTFTGGGASGRVGYRFLLMWHSADGSYPAKGDTLNFSFSYSNNGNTLLSKDFYLQV